MSDTITPPEAAVAPPSTALDACKKAMTTVTDEELRREFLASGRSLLDYAKAKIDPALTLLGDRFLCCGGALLMVAPSGVGKSSAGVQQDLLWSLGREAFGIKPARSLRILCFQAENDDGDVTEMARGVMSGLKLTDDEKAQVDERTFYVSCSLTDEAFLQQLDQACRFFKPDIVRIDPLNAYLGDDPKNPKAIAWFCRDRLNRIAKEHRCGIIVVHHTPKTNLRGDTSTWSVTDWGYAGAGAADLSNWVRAIIVIDAVDAKAGLYRFIAAKRGYRTGWEDPVGVRVFERCFKHAREPGVIRWDEADSGEVAAATSKKAQKTPDDLLALVPADGTIEKAMLLALASQAGIGENKARGFIKLLVDQNRLEESQDPRPGKKGVSMLARYCSGL